MLSVRRASAKNTAADVRSSQPPLLGAQRSGIISLAESDASETFTLPIFLVPERLSYSTPKHVGNAFGGAPRLQKAQRWGPAPRHWRQQRALAAAPSPTNTYTKLPQAPRGPVSAKYFLERKSKRATVQPRSGSLTPRPARGPVSSRWQTAQRSSH